MMCGAWNMVGAWTESMSAKCTSYLDTIFQEWITHAELGEKEKMEILITTDCDFCQF